MKKIFLIFILILFSFVLLYSEIEEVQAELLSITKNLESRIIKLEELNRDQQLHDIINDIKFQINEISREDNNPKIIHIKVNEIGDGNIIRLQKELRRGLLNLGLEVDDRNWVPHITIGRVKDYGLKFSIPNMQIEPIEWEVNSIDLMGSELRPAGPEYSVIRKFKLK